MERNRMLAARVLNRIGFGLMCLSVASALGATAVFVPLGPTTVPPRTDVSFDVDLAVGTLPAFEAADVVIGSDHAFDLVFTYAPQWEAAFLNVTPPVSDVGFYAQDVFVGGNNPSAVGAGMRIKGFRRHSCVFPWAGGAHFRSVPTI